MSMPPDKQVLQDRGLFKQFDVLKGPRDAKAGHLIRSMFEQILTIKADAPFGRIIEPRDQVKDRGFSGTVGADKGKNLALVDPQGDVVDRDKPTKPERDIINFKQAHWTRSVLRYDF
jgi:hypothetical protein